MNQNLGSTQVIEENIQGNVNYTPRTQQANVVGLMPDSPYNRIISFINSYESKNTRTAYTGHFKKMFGFICGKSLEQLTYDDIRSIDDMKVENFRNYLKKTYANSSINSIIAACKALFDKFKERRIIEINDFDIEPLLVKDNSYGSLTSKEIEGLLEYCLKQEYKPMTLKLYFEFLYKVTCRKDAAQQLTWEQINKELDIETETLICVVTFMDKGKEVKKAIQDEFYNKLRQNYENENGKNNKVFLGINDKTYDKVLKGFLKEWGIGKNRNITQHSIKSTGLDRVYTITHDHNMTALAGQHLNFNTSYQKYTNKNRRLSEHPSYFLDKDFSIDMLKGLGEDVLLELIKQAGNETIVTLCLKLERETGRE